MKSEDTQFPGVKVNPVGQDKFFMATEREPLWAWVLSQSKLSGGLFADWLHPMPPAVIQPSGIVEPVSKEEFSARLSSAADNVNKKPAQKKPNAIRTNCKRCQRKRRYCTFMNMKAVNR